MLIGYMRVSTDTDRQTTDLQRDALLKAGVDPRHLFEDYKSGAKDQRPGLAAALAYVKEGDCPIYRGKLSPDILIYNYFYFLRNMTSRLYFNK